MVKKKLKVVILGMENAGKSTIVKILNKSIESAPENPPDMKPTKGVAKNQCLLNGKKIVVWDFGGQETYRTDYVENPDKYFKSVSYLYYVIDSQDYSRVMSAIMYFSGVLNFIRNLSANVKIVFVFHKMDPDFDPIEKNVRAKFLENIEPNLKANNIPFEIYETTVYHLSSIKAAFSQI